MASNSKKGNYDNLKFLAVLAAIFVIILVIYFISRGSETKNPPINTSNTPLPTSPIDNTPAPTHVVDNTPEVTKPATSTPVATPYATDTPVPTSATTPGAEATKAPTNTPSNTPAAPTPALTIKSSEAKKALDTVVDPSLYTATLLSGTFSPNGDGETYYRYEIKDKSGKLMQPEMLVHSITASVYCYQDGKVFDCVQFPLDSTEAGGENNVEREISASEAVKILMTFGRDQLQLQNDPSKYTAKVDPEPSVTLVDADGIMAYLILLVDKDDKLVGAYAVSVDGIFVYIRDELDPNSFIRVTEG